MTRVVRLVQSLHPNITATTTAVAAALCCAAGTTAMHGAAEVQKKLYDVPGGDAAVTLPQFARHSGNQIVYLIENIRGEITQPVRGRFTALEALRKMLAGTALFAVQDEGTGAIVVSRRRPSREAGKEGDEVRRPEHARAPPTPATRSAVPPRNSQSKQTSPLPVKPRNFLAFLAGWLFASTAVDAQTTGAIEGRVFNAAMGTALVNVRVMLEGTGREVITDESGSFRFSGVPAGEASLNVAYVGMQRASATVNVPAGGTVQREFELVREGAPAREEIVTLDTVTVVVDREMSAQAVAMNEQRTAPNIKNVVAIDEFGDRGTENIGEFLLFLPGVSLETSGSEAATVLLRGFPNVTTNLNIDGGAVAFSLSGGDTRHLDLREIPMSNISRIEVTKVPTPDMFASGLGGSLNLISRNGFEAKQPQFSFNAYTNFHDSNGIAFDAGRRTHIDATSPKWIQPSFDFSYLRPINRNLAITVGGGRTWRLQPIIPNETADWDLARLFQRQSTWNGAAQVIRTLSARVGIDWRISPRDTLSTSFQFRRNDLYVTRNLVQFAYGTGATGDRYSTQGAANGVGTVTMNGSGTNVDNVTDTRLITGKYKRRGDVWSFDLAGSYSDSATDKMDMEKGHFAATPATFSNLVLRGEGIPDSGGIIPTRYSALDRSGQSVALYDGGNYSINSATSRAHQTNSQSLTARADLAREFGTRVPLTIKVGTALARIDREEYGFFESWNFRPNGASDVAARLARNFDVFDETFNRESPTLYGQSVRWISNPKLFQLFREHPDWFISDPAQTHQDKANSSKEFTEIVSAGYVRGDVRLLDRRLWLVGGVRYERTDFQGRGPLNDITAQYRRNADGSFVDGNPNQPGIQRVLKTTDPLALRQLRFVERGAYAKRNYGDWYPSLNASFTVIDNLILRAAYARTLGRPNSNFIIPGVTITEPDVALPTITVNNPALEPWTADSFDLSLESYQIKDGFGSISVFQKGVKNFFGVVTAEATPELLAEYGLEGDPSLLNYTISTRTNAGDAKIRGVEFSYRQSLTFLPPWARGFQVFVNVTKLELGGSNTADFTGYNPKVLGGGINFVREHFFIKGTISHVGELRRNLVAVNANTGIPPNTYQYEAKRTRIGINAQYSLTRRYSLYASVNDLGGFVRDLLRYTADTPKWARGAQHQELGFYYVFGVRGTF